MFVMTLLALTLAADPACTPQRPVASLATRASKYDSTMAKVGAATVKVCYSRPLMKGRTIFGSEMVPYGKLWRTGANEPTIIHTTAPIMVAGVRLEAGSYSFYTVPQQRAPWEIVLNRSISQWGIEGGYEAVKGQEVGRGKAPSMSMPTPVEMFTITAAPTSLTLSWEKTMVMVPVTAAK